MIYLRYYYNFELQGRLGGKQKNPPQQQKQKQKQKQLPVLLDLTAIAASNTADLGSREMTCSSR